MAAKAFIAAAPLALLLSACVTTDDSGGDGAFYPSGFADGCRTAQSLSASFASKRVRDDSLFEAEGSYRAGWRAGYNQCRGGNDFDNRPGDLGEWETY